MAESISVFAIEYSSNGLPLAIQGENLSIRRFQVIDEKQINRVVREMPPTARVIVDTEAFHGHGSLTARKYVQAIRAAHNGKPSVLFLRYGTPSDNIIENDKLAGATDVLYHSALTGTIDTRRMNHFIRDGVLPPPPEKKRPPGNAANLINALNRHASDASESVDDHDEIPLPDSREEPPRIAKEKPSETARTTHQGRMRPPPVSKSILQRIMTPAESKTPDLGEVEMKALLTAFETLIGQNAQILTALEKIQGGINGLRADREVALLAQMQEKVSTAMNDVFAQLQKSGETPSPAMTVASADSITSSTLAVSTGAKDAPAPDAAPEKKEPVAILTKHGRNGTITLFGKTVGLPYSSAELLTHFVNTGKTLGTTDIASLYKLGKQGGYFRMSHLLEGLDAFQKGLSSCLTLVQSGNSKNYRFDADEFCRIMKVK